MYCSMLWVHTLTCLSYTRVCPTWLPHAVKACTLTLCFWFRFVNALSNIGVWLNFYHGEELYRYILNDIWGNKKTAQFQIRLVGKVLQVISGVKNSPDFKKLHEAHFSKMESIDSYMQRKNKQMEVLRNSVKDLKVYFSSFLFICAPLPFFCDIHVPLLIRSQ